MDFFKTIFASKYGDGAIALNGSFFDTLLGKSLGGDTPAPVMPSKGDIIGIDMDGDGTDEQYLVLKAVGSDNVVEVLGRTSVGRTAFSSYNSKAYLNKPLDSLLNSTFYNTLSVIAKSAIVPKTIFSSLWYRNSSSGSPKYYGRQGEGTEYTVSLYVSPYGESLDRNVYALSVQEVLDYLNVTPQMTFSDTTLTSSALAAMFNTSATESINTIWLRDALESGYNGMRITANSVSESISANTAIGSGDSRPAFQIDLSKIAWSPVTE